MRRGGNRTSVMCVVVVMLATVMDCSPSDERSGRATASASPTPAAADDVVEVLQRFWAERIRVETSGDYASANFEGIVAPDQIEPLRQRYSQFAAGNFHRVGKPLLRDFTATVEADRAVATVCVNEDDWGADADGDVEPPADQGWYASSHHVVLTNGTWLITGDAAASEVSC